MASVNSIHIIGRLGADPEVKNVGTTKVARMRVATSEKWTTRSGEEKQRTDWHTIVAWNSTDRPLAEIAEKYLKKGTQVYVDGRLHYSVYEKNGEKRYNPEIEAEKIWGLDSKAPEEPQAPNLPPMM